MKTKCQDILITNPTILRPNHTLAQALQALQKEHVRYLPVVDEQGDFVGLFSSLTLITLLLPQTISMDLGIPAAGLNFMTTSTEELHHRLQDLSDKPISEYITHTDLSVCHPESSIMEAIYLLHKFHSHVMITEKDSRRFVGIVSINSILNAIG